MFKKSFERSIEEKNKYEVAYKKALESLKEDAIKMEDFYDIYGEEDVKADLREVERLKKVFEEKNLEEDKETKKFATIFESIIHYHGEMSDWFGPNSFTYKSCEYDDFKNKVDEIVEVEDGSQENFSHLGLAIDVTTTGSLYKKLAPIWDDLKKGNLGEVKYFNSKEGGLKNLPRVVISADKREVEELMELWLEENKKELVSHPIQFHILDQIKIQLEKSKIWLKEKGENNLAEIFEDRLNLIDKILKEKQEVRGQLEKEGKMERQGSFSRLGIIEKNIDSLIEEDKN